MPVVDSKIFGKANQPATFEKLIPLTRPTLDLASHSAVKSNYMAAKKSKTSQSTISTAPRVFVSYTHESKENKAWVLKLATDLRKYGVDAILDVWECKYGS